MKQETNLLPLGFDATIAFEAKTHLKTEKYLNETWLQIVKDFHLAGLTVKPDRQPVDLDELLEALLSLLPPPDRSHDRSSLLYRIDLPQRVEAVIHTDEELAMAIAIRAFQKVWLRQHLSGEPDGFDPTKTS